MSSQIDEETMRRHKRHEEFQEKTLRKLDHLERRMSQIMASIEEVQEALATLTSDLEGLASTASAEFAKLEEELSAEKVEVDLGPTKEAIEALDSRVKGAAGEIPTN